MPNASLAESADQSSPVVETLKGHHSSFRANSSHFPATISPSTVRLNDLEHGDLGRDPRLKNGQRLGLAILIAAALCGVYIIFVTVLVAIALKVAW